MCFIHKGVISILCGKLLKLIDQSIYLSSNIWFAESNVNIHITKVWNAMDGWFFYAYNESKNWSQCKKSLFIKPSKFFYLYLDTKFKNCAYQYCTWLTLLRGKLFSSHTITILQSDKSNNILEFCITDNFSGTLEILSPCIACQYQLWQKWLLPLTDRWNVHQSADFNIWFWWASFWRKIAHSSRCYQRGNPFFLHEKINWETFHIQRL